VPLAAAPLIRKLRLAAGLALFAYVVSHLANHALGLISYEAMERGLTWALVVWRSGPGTVLLYGAFLTHLSLGLWSLYRRRTLRMPPWEAAQLVLGLAIPPILLFHMSGTRLADELLGTTPSYGRTLLRFWVIDPQAGFRQVLLLLIAWTHGCMGVHFWLRFRPWYARVAPWLFAVALLLPTLALLGFVAAGREVTALARTPGWTEATLRAAHAPTGAEAARLATIRSSFLTAYLLARQRFAGKSLFEFGTMLSFAIPGTVIGVSYILAFNVPPIELTGTGVILVLCFVFRNMPVGVRAGIAALSQIDRSLDEASLTLGARTGTTLRRVVAPLLRPAIAAALVYSFVRAMTAVSAVIFLVSARYNLATAYIVGRVEAGEFGLAIAYSAVLIVVMLAAIVFIQWLVGERRLGRRAPADLGLQTAGG